MDYDARDKPNPSAGSLRSVFLRIAVTDSSKARVDIVDIESITLIAKDEAESEQVVSRLRFDRAAGAYEDLALPRHVQGNEFKAIEIAWSLPKRPSTPGTETTRTIRQRLNIDLGLTGKWIPHIRLVTSTDKLVSDASQAFSAELMQPSEDAIACCPKIGTTRSCGPAIVKVEGSAEPSIATDRIVICSHRRGQLD
jgi:hypothetical protein